MNKTSLEGTCQAYIEGISTPYDYVPSLAAGITFCALLDHQCWLTSSKPRGPEHGGAMYLRLDV